MKKHVLTLLLTLLIGLSFIPVAVAQKLPGLPMGKEISFELVVPDSIKSIGATYQSVGIRYKVTKGLGSNFILSQMKNMKTPIMLGVMSSDTTSYHLGPIKAFSKTYSA